MNNIKWTKWKKGGLAAVVAGAIVAGTLAVAPVAFAQTPTPIAPAGTATAQTSPMRPQGRGGMRGGPHASLSVVATALGIDEAALQTELQAGKTISDVAASKGVALSVVSDALLAAEKTQLAQAVTDGKLTQAEADARLADAPARINDMLTRTMPAGKGPEGRGGRGGPGGLGSPHASLSVVATALGIDETALQTELQAGKTISDVAASKGVALSVVSNALLTEEKTRLAQAVTDGKLTQAQADERLANAQTRIDEMLTRTMPARPQGVPGQGGPRGPRQPGATQPGTAPTSTPAPTV